MCVCLFSFFIEKGHLKMSLFNVITDTGVTVGFIVPSTLLLITNPLDSLLDLLATVKHNRLKNLQEKHFYQLPTESN